MRGTPHALTMLGLLLSAFAAAGQDAPPAYDLRGPATQAGHTLILTVDTEMAQGEMKGDMMGQAMEAAISAKTHHLIQFKVLEVDEDGPARVEQRYAESVMSTEMVRDDADEAEVEKSEQRQLEGAALILTREGKKDWEAQLQQDQGDNEDEPSPQRGEMQMFLESMTYIAPRLAYPQEPVAVGGTWKVDDEQVAAILGHCSLFPGGEYDGTIRCELLEVAEVGGRRVAVIRYEADVDVTTEMAAGPGEMKAVFTIEGEGLIERDLTTFTDTNVFEGEMELDFRQRIEGQNVGRISAEMPITASFNQTRK